MKKHIRTLLLLLTVAAVLFSGMTAMFSDTTSPAEDTFIDTDPAEETHTSTLSLSMQMIQYENENLSWEDYGFSYFDGDGHLVVCVLENSKKDAIANKVASLNRKAEKTASTNGSSDQPKIFIRTVKYSFQDLMNAKDRIFGARIEGVWAVSASATQNKVIVTADPLTNALKRAVYKLVPRDIVTFEKGRIELS